MKKEQKFTHLHLHSDYSLLDGLSKITDIVETAKKLGMDSVALTDHGNMYGAIELYKAAKKNDIKPVIGIETYITNNRMKDKNPAANDKRWHLILLAETNEGYRNLIQLTTLSHLEGFYYKPRIDKDTLRKYSKGIIALSGCLGGEIGSYVLSGRIEDAKKAIAEYKDIFGDNNFFLEVQRNIDDREQKILNTALFELSKETDTELVATADSHYINADDKDVHEILLAIQTGKTIKENNRMSLAHLNLSIASPADMYEAFKDHPEAVENSQKIADRCDVKIELGNYQLPHYEVPKSHTVTTYLRKKCVEGLKTRYNISTTGIKDFKKEVLPQKKKSTDTEKEILQRLD